MRGDVARGKQVLAEENKKTGKQEALHDAVIEKICVLTLKIINVLIVINVESLPYNIKKIEVTVVILRYINKIEFN